MASPALTPSTKQYFDFDRVNGMLYIKSGINKPYHAYSAYHSLTTIKGCMVKDSLYKESQIQETNLKEIATKIFDGYNKKFGFSRFFNFFLVLVGRGDKKYNRIQDLYKQIMETPHNKLLINLPDNIELFY